MSLSASSLPGDTAVRVRLSFNCVLTATLLLTLFPSTKVFASDAKTAVLPDHPVAQSHILRPASGTPSASPVRGHLKPRTTPRNAGPVNLGSGIVYTCDPTIDAKVAGTCAYLNTTVAGYYNDTFTNANANIYIKYGTTGLGESTTGFYNFVTFSQYLTAYTAITAKSPLQTSALSALNSNDQPAYGSDKISITSALGTALGFPGLAGTTAGGTFCTVGTGGCYNGIIIVTNDPSITLYFDQVGGPEPSDAYDFYAVVGHETDEVLGTSSCISTQSGPNLQDPCDSAASDGHLGNPSAVDLYRYSGANDLVLDGSLSQTPGAYFSYNGGATNGANGKAGTPKVYNTLANGDDYADFVSSSPDCGTDQAIQDGEGCPGEDAGLTILNDGGGEVNILTAVGYSVPVNGVPAVLTSPLGGTVLAGPSVTFSWTTSAGATGYGFRLGTTAGGNDIWSSGHVTTTSATAKGIPTNGATVYGRLYTLFGSTTKYNDYTFTAATRAALTSPTGGSVLTGTSETFNWTTAANATGYALRLGTTVGGNDIWSSGHITTTSATAKKLPTNGSTVYGRLYTIYGSIEVYTDYTFSAQGSPCAALGARHSSAGSRATVSGCQ